MKIAEIVDQKKPAHGEKGQYGYVRKPEEKPKRPRRKRNASEIDGSEPVAGPSGLNTVDYSVSIPVGMPPLQGMIGTVGGPSDTFNPVMYAPQASVFRQMPVPAPPALRPPHEEGFLNNASNS